jgi:hypothetical protein
MPPNAGQTTNHCVLGIESELTSIVERHRTAGGAAGPNPQKKRCKARHSRFRSNCRPSRVMGRGHIVLDGLERLDPFQLHRRSAPGPRRPAHRSGAKHGPSRRRTRPDPSRPEVDSRHSRTCGTPEKPARWAIGRSALPSAHRHSPATLQAAFARHPAPPDCGALDRSTRAPRRFDRAQARAHGLACLAATLSVARQV